MALRSANLANADLQGATLANDADLQAPCWSVGAGLRCGRLGGQHQAGGCEADGSEKGETYPA